MAEIKDKCVFFAKADQCKFITRTNGDRIHFSNGVHVGQDDSAALAYLIQSGKQLKITIKEV